VKSCGGERYGKRRGNPRHVWLGETSVSKPSDDASINQPVVKTRGAEIFWDKPAGHLITGQAATGVQEA
jgi:hypothetical protein